MKKRQKHLNQADDAYGYSIEPIRKDGRECLKVTLPSGRNTIIQKDDTLLVINNEPKYVIKTAQDVVSCVRDYVLKREIRHFTVDGFPRSQEEIEGYGERIKGLGILFLSIKKHNKAG